MLPWSIPTVPLPASCCCCPTRQAGTCGDMGGPWPVHAGAQALCSPGNTLSLVLSPARWNPRLGPDLCGSCCPSVCGQLALPPWPPRVPETQSSPVTPVAHTPSECSLISENTRCLPCSRPGLDGDVPQITRDRWHFLRRRFYETVWAQHMGFDGPVFTLFPALIHLRELWGQRKNPW